jgi:hypothetical protein
MTCVWEGIKNRLHLNMGTYELFKFIQGNNRDTRDILWNKEKLPDKLLAENMQRIRELSSDSIEQGYLCSACDPLLFLVATLFNVSIIHNFNGARIHYHNVKFPDKIIHFESSSGHFW